MFETNGVNEMNNNRGALLVGGTATALFLAAVAVPFAAHAAEGEFGGQCAMGLALGIPLQTTCDVTWKWEDGKTYCFSSEKSKADFLKETKQNLAKAQKFYKATTKN